MADDEGRGAEGGPKADPRLETPVFEAGAGHVPVPDPTDERPVFEAGAGRGGVAAGRIVSPHPDEGGKHDGQDEREPRDSGSGGA